jgi:hypothetical protein
VIFFFGFIKLTISVTWFEIPVDSEKIMILLGISVNFERFFMGKRIKNEGFYMYNSEKCQMTFFFFFLGMGFRTRIRPLRFDTHISLNTANHTLILVPFEPP